MSAISDLQRGRAGLHDRAGRLAARARALVAAVSRHRQYVALGLFVGGWSALWAHGLALVGFIPDWLSVFAMVGGLALIPWVVKSDAA